MWNRLFGRLERANKAEKFKVDKSFSRDLAIVVCGSQRRLPYDYQMKRRLKLLMQSLAATAETTCAY